LTLKFKLNLTREEAFFVGNVVGIMALIGVIIITAPMKMAEQKQLEEAAKSQILVTAVIAKKPMATGTVFDATNVAEERLSSELVPKEALKSLKDAVGQICNRPINRDEVITTEYLRAKPKEAVKIRGFDSGQLYDAAGC